jgi:hypothetical protein
MEASEDVAAALRTFFEKNASGDPATFDDVVSSDESVLAIGSAAREWFAGQTAVRAAYGIEGLQVDPGDVQAWKSGNIGWAASPVVFSAPDAGFSIRLRFTAIFVREGGAWKLLQLHGSYPVPDEVAAEHPEWWAVSDA